MAREGRRRKKRRRADESDGYYLRLSEYNKDRKERGDREQYPDLKFYGDPEEAWQLYTMLEALEWKWPIDVIERQDAVKLHDVIVWKFGDNRVKEMLKKD